ncbi:hypothetical protein N7536_010186 [Penicillium majusculum]|uniref:FAD-binding domain-containing protein n=1 Tax=Penicillium solitum TaxID=60172 RepID=A0A1V6QXL9_9EURO|nr:uncharacterized protein PENSOL_c030G04352 [Penicillium solitum]KAJ5687567.1 hypothetical protein N7536_010186 [Penicillium majusculum]OQD93746.1 hypothetical protein PENSOL_c030G04352 [Penicillium solitum]
MHVLIVGGGLGGLSLAQSLRKQGISFEIFERDADENARFQGWAIALHSIIDRLSSSVPSDLPDLRESTNHLSPLKLPPQIAMYLPGRTDRVGFEDSPQFPIIRAERGRLRKWLATNIPVRWGCQVTRIEHDEHGVSVHLADGSIAKGDFLVGADGINSVVREHLLQQPSKDLLRVVPLATVVGELTLSGEAFKRQLSLGHSGYMCIRPDLGFIAFVGLHYTLPDGLSGRYYWNFMQTSDVSDPNHWLQTASPQEKRDRVLNAIGGMPAELREIFEQTPVEGIRPESHVWRDIELDSLPAGRIILVGDAAHAMTPFRGEGGYHTLIDTLLLGNIFRDMNTGAKFEDPAAVGEIIASYNKEMLQRGRKAVQDSRNVHGNAGRVGPDGKPLVVEMVPLSDLEIKLGIDG